MYATALPGPGGAVLLSGVSRGGRILGRMTLDELIAALGAEDPDRVLPLGFTNPHSFRGDYADLAFEPTANVTVGNMLADARSAHGATYEGWKGGDFTMIGWTDCWLSEEGTSNGAEPIGPILLTLLLAAGQLDAGTRDKLAAFEPESVRLRKEWA